MMQLTNGQHTCELVFKPNADILNIHRDYQFVFSVLNELMFHTMLDAASVVPRVHYKSMNNSAKIIKIFESYGHKCTATFFMVHSVQSSLCVSISCI